MQKQSHHKHVLFENKKNPARQPFARHIIFIEFIYHPRSEIESDYLIKMTHLSNHTLDI